ncbi:hypothetical protein ACHAWF_005950 [Thalassiosira exigua]
MGGIARVRVADPQRRPCRNVVSREGVIVPGVVELRRDFRIIAPVVEVICHRNDLQVSALRFETSGVHDLVRPLAKVPRVVFEVVAEKWDPLDRVFRQALLRLSFFFRQFPHQRRQRLQADVSHRGRVCIISGQGVQPREPRALPPLLNFAQYLQHQVPLTILGFAALADDESLRLSHGLAPQLFHRLVAGQYQRFRDEKNRLAGRQVLRRRRVDFLSPVFLDQPEPVRSLDAAVARPALHRHDLPFRALEQIVGGVVVRFDVIEDAQFDRSLDDAQLVVRGRERGSTPGWPIRRREARCDPCDADERRAVEEYHDQLHLRLLCGAGRGRGGGARTPEVSLYRT